MPTLLAIRGPRTVRVAFGQGLSRRDGRSARASTGDSLTWQVIHKGRGVACAGPRRRLPGRWRWRVWNGVYGHAGDRVGRRCRDGGAPAPTGRPLERRLSIRATPPALRVL